MASSDNGGTKPPGPPLSLLVGDPRRVPPKTQEALSRHHLIYSICGLVLGLVCVIAGVVLFFAGVTGAMSWTAKFLGAESQILDAAPGAVIFIVGLFIVWITKFHVRFQSQGD